MSLQILTNGAFHVIKDWGMNKEAGSKWKPLDGENKGRVRKSDELS